MTMQEQIVHRTSDLSYAAGAATTGAGMWAWLGQNATAVGALCALVGALICVATFALNWHFKHKYFEIDRRKR